jgi:hypothetical protein
MQYIPTMLCFENSLQILLETPCILAPALTSFAVSEGRCCTAESTSLMNALHWTLYLRALGKAQTFSSQLIFFTVAQFYDQRDGVTRTVPLSCNN